MKKSSYILCLLLLLALLAGCSGVVQVPPPQASVDKPADLSIYKAYRTGSADVKPLAPDKDLKYVDTAYMTALMKTVPATSAKRTSYEQAPPEWPFVLIDARPPVKYQEGHINGAINIPDADFDKFQNRLPADRDTPLYFYCGGLECKLSPSAAKKALALGYRNVYVYQEGDPFWLADGNYLVVTSGHIAALLMDENMNNARVKPTVLLDTRPYAMYYGGHIPGAIEADDGLFPEKFRALLPADKSLEIITYCSGFNCHKSHLVARLLRADGYKNVKVYAGGLPLWQQEGLPVIGAGGTKGSLDITGGKPSRKLSPVEFQQKLAAGTAVVIDVRTTDERAGGYMKDSLHIPDGDIKADPKAAASKLPADKTVTVLIHCASGARAAGVADIIAAEGYANTFYLNNRISFKSDGSYSFD